MKKQIFILLSLLIPSQLFAAEWKGSILYFLDPPQDHLAVIDGGNASHVQEGMIFYSYRATQAKLLIPTGKLKILKVNEETSLAEVMESTHPVAQKAFADYPFIMAQDMVKTPVHTIRPVQQIMESMVLRFNQLFKAPQANPSNFELSSGGKQELAKLAQTLGKKRVSKLLVNAHTDDKGPSEANQMESYQRALTVRNYLIQELKLDGERIAAMGLGELEPLDQSYVSGYEANNRRIEFKIVSE